MDSTPRTRAAALAVLMTKELCSLFLSIRESQEYPLEAFVKWWQSQALLCVILLVLLITELISGTAGVVWHAVPPMEPYEPSWRWVNTVRVMEWLINMPIILTLAGHYLMRRPLKEVLGPALISVVYIIASWLAVVVVSIELRWLLLVVSFFGYIWSSLLMFKWMASFRFESGLGVYDRRGRMVLVVLLVADFATYGVVILLGTFGSISARLEEELYALDEFMLKLTLAFALGILRSSERREALRRINERARSLNKTLLPMLTHQFDFLLLCEYDPEASRCLVTGHLKATALGTCLGRPVEGMSFEELLFTEDDRSRFQQHLRLVLSQREARKSPAVAWGMPKLASSSFCDVAKVPSTGDGVYTLATTRHSRCRDLRAEVKVWEVPSNGVQRQLVVALHMLWAEKEAAKAPLLPFEDGIRLPPVRVLASTSRKECVQVHWSNDSTATPEGSIESANVLS